MSTTPRYEPATRTVQTKEPRPADSPHPVADQQMVTPLLHSAVLQASGMVMARLGCSIEQATDYLHHQARARHTTADALAREVIRRHVQFQPTHNSPGPKN